MKYQIDYIEYNIYIVQNDFSTKDKEISRLKLEIEKNELKECTFRPKINSKSRSISAKVRRVSNNKVSVIPSDMECTFHPQTNNIKNNMKLAENYIKQDPFKRLSTPNCKNMRKQLKQSNKVLDFNEYIKILNKHSEKENILQVNKSVKKEEKKQKIEDFLERQEIMRQKSERKKQKLIEEIKESETPKKPKILHNFYSTKMYFT